MKTDFKDEDIVKSIVLIDGDKKPYIAVIIKGEMDSINFEYKELTGMLSQLYRKTNELKKEGK